LVGPALEGMDGRARPTRARYEPPRLHETGPEPGFTLTDGRRSYAARLVEAADRQARLLVFADAMPPAATDLWVAAATLGPGHATRSDDTAPGVICFTPGTRLRTPDGARPIESIRPGDRLLTRDNGPQEVLWTASRRMTGARLYALPHLRPVRIRAGALGSGRPDADLLVSPRHRMVVEGPAARALFGEAEVLVTAEDLVDGAAVTVDLGTRETTYIHVLLERHEVVWANDLATESFHPGAADLTTLDPRDRFALQAILPELAGDPGAYGDYARRCLGRAEAAILAHDRAA
ncbi:MAG TPA: Hint domain-containing protein, partial [Paracoccaceae bacterium]|nr:Hint domain-containing protein [Paracoccaceae bacterium]